MVRRTGFRPGLVDMNRTKRISLWAACLEIGGYPELLWNLAREHELIIHEKGRARYLNREDLEPLARHVREWLNRPRMSRQFKIAGRPATELARPRKKASGEVVGGGS
jgi:hypothetical protein